MPQNRARFCHGFDLLGLIINGEILGYRIYFIRHDFQTRFKRLEENMKYIHIKVLQITAKHIINKYKSECGTNNF